MPAMLADAFGDSKRIVNFLSPFSLLGEGLGTRDYVLLALPSKFLERCTEDVK